MHLIDGKALASKIQMELKGEIEAKHLSPHLAILLVGDDPASHLYVSLKQQRAMEIGIQTTLTHLPATTPDHELTAWMEKWNQDPHIHGILVQIPLPPGHDENAVIGALDPKKDADGFHSANIQQLLTGSPTIIPPVHEGILRLINETPLKLSGSSVTIIVNSEIFSTPLKRLLETAGMFVTIMNPDALDKTKLLMADLVIIAVGRAHFLHASMTKPDAVIIDVGTNKTAEGKTIGDVDLASYQNTDAWITPVPGGVGPMTIAQLLKNVVQLSL